MATSKLAFQIKAIKSITQLGESAAACQATLEDTQDLAEELLYAEARMGEMLTKTTNTTSSRAGKRQLPDGINYKQSHYAQELGRNEDAIVEVVAKAREAGEIPVRNQVLKLVQANKPKLETPKMAEGEYGVVYADPPWEYDFSSTTSRQIENKYPTMTVDEIKTMTLPETKNAVLYLWATAPKLIEALSVVIAWGFEYKTCLVWDKEIIGMGYWFRGQHELLLVGAEGCFVESWLAYRSKNTGP